MKDLVITYSLSDSPEELQQILELQKRNLPLALSDQVKISEGFVTVEHDFKLLSEIHGGHGHTIAKIKGRVIGYALTMLCDYKQSIDILKPMFEVFDQIKLGSQMLNQMDFFVMGQVCIDEEFRKKGVFRGLYQKMKRSFQNKFELVVTEIDGNNQRSLSAHLNVGFETIYTYCSRDGVQWHIVAMPLE